MLARDPATRRLAARILGAQAATTIVIAALCLVFAGRTQALSALAGGGIGLVANAYMSFSALRPISGAAGALGRLMFAQLVKVALTQGGMLIVGGRGQLARAHPRLRRDAVCVLLVPVLQMRTRRAG
jgi:F0F1-type ATP synthase assembly protein I